MGISWAEYQHSVDQPCQLAGKGRKCGLWVNGFLKVAFGIIAEEECVLGYHQGLGLCVPIGALETGASASEEDSLASSVPGIVPFYIT